MIGIIILGIVILLVAGYALLVQIKRMKLAVVSKKWPKVPGKILGSHVKVDDKAIYNGIPVESRTIKVRYEYLIGNKKYLGVKIDFNERMSTAYFGMGAETPYFAGKKVEVSYDPGNKELAILRPGLRLKYFLRLLLILYFVALGVFFAILPILFPDL